MISITSKYVPNLAAIELAAHGPGVIAAQNIVANQIYDSAIAIAPVATGAYQASIQVEGGADPVVYSSIRYAQYIEFGTSDTPVFATLRRASETAHI